MKGCEVRVFLTSVSFTPLLLYPEGKSLSTHWIGDWTNTRGHVHAVKKRQRFACGTYTFPVLLLYWLICPGQHELSIITTQMNYRPYARIHFLVRLSDVKPQGFNINENSISCFRCWWSRDQGSITGGIDVFIFVTDSIPALGHI
jgi:hypothetical protein